MDYHALAKTIADILEAFDYERPVHKAFTPGIGPFGEPQIVREIALGIQAKTPLTPDLDVSG